MFQWWGWVWLPNQRGALGSQPWACAYNHKFREEEAPAKTRHSLLWVCESGKPGNFASDEIASRINDLCDDHILATPRVPLAPYIIPRSCQTERPRDGNAAP